MCASKLSQQATLEIDAAPFQSCDFLEQRERIDHHPAADDANLFAVERARRHQAQDEFLAADDQRMRRVVAALKAHDDFGVGGEQINDFALALVTPLGSHHRDSIHAR